MGLARDLSMGPRRPRRTIAAGPAYATIRRALEAADPDPVALRAALDAIAAGPRLRQPEGYLYLAGWDRYREITGSEEGPRKGTY